MYVKMMLLCFLLVGQDSHCDMMASWATWHTAICLDIEAISITVLKLMPYTTDMIIEMLFVNLVASKYKSRLNFTYTDKISSYQYFGFAYSR